MEDAGDAVNIALTRDVRRLYNRRMILLIACLSVALLSFASAVVLQLRLRGWKVLSGLIHSERDGERSAGGAALARGLSVAMYLCSSVFLGLSFALYARLLSPLGVMRVAIPSCLVLFDAMWIMHRIHDKTVYTDGSRRRGMAVFIAANACFVSMLLALL